MYEKLADYATTKRVEWITKWPGQVIILVGQIHWTSEIEERSRATAGAHAREYAEKCTGSVRTSWSSCAAS